VACQPGGRLGAVPHAACATGLILPAELDTQAAQWFEAYAGFGKAGNARCSTWPSTAGRARCTLRHGPVRVRRLPGLQDGRPAPPRRVRGRAGRRDPSPGREDLDIFLRLLAIGAAIVYEPGAILRHRHLGDDATLRRQLHGYGVGLGAALTKCLLDRPIRALDLAVRLPAGLAYLLSPASPKNRRKRADFPGELTRVELRGVLAGPAAYLRSPRRQSSQTRT
jgi:hypothetical protein